MKKIIILLVVLLVLGGGGAGGYFYFMKPAEAAHPESEDGKVEKKAEKKEKHDDAHVEFVELDPLILPIIDENGVNQTVSLVVAIEVSAPESAGKVNAWRRV